ncbi:hypothetical protein ES703_46832 [subsurface metagenome]
MGKGDKGYRIGFPTPDTYYESSLTDAATVARTITKDHEIIVLDELGQGTTLNLTINADVEIGAEIMLKSSCGSTAYDITLGTGTDAATITGIVDKINWSHLVYDGSQYNLVSIFQDNQTPMTSENTGTVGTGTTAVEYGNGIFHLTVLTVAGVLSAIAGSGNHAVGLKVYTLPTSAQIIKSAYMSIGITQSEGNIDSDTPKVGLGTTLGATAVANLTNPATLHDILAEQDANNCTGTAEVKTVGDQVLVIETGSAHTVHFNAADSWAGADAAAIVAGTIILEWINIV